MKHILLQRVRKFLEREHQPGRPVLLGISGGPDSKALLKLLYHCKADFNLDLRLVHVDHRWANESTNDGEILKLEADKLGLLFYPYILQSPSDDKNMEDRARRQRHEIFAALYKEIDAQAVFLAHHQDDQAEVVLKRLFEGANLLSLSGLKDATKINGMSIWRPLLGAPKSLIVNYLNCTEEGWFNDPSNSNPRFLRARMRLQILPYLSELFGKDITDNLVRLGETAGKLAVYFNKKMQPYLACVQRSDNIVVDLSNMLDIDSLELTFFLKSFLDGEGYVFSRAVLDDIDKHILKGSSDVCFICGNKKVIINKRKMILI